MQQTTFQKIMIFGKPGSGKSTFATWLSSYLRLPLHHLDKYFFIHNWAQRDYNEFIQLQEDMVNTTSWIIDGNSMRSLDMRWSKADLVLYFNFSKIICVYRLFKRLLHPNSFDDRAEGCKDSISLNLLKYTWEFEKRYTQYISMLKTQYPHTLFKEITSTHDLSQLKHELFT